MAATSQEKIARPAQLRGLVVCIFSTFLALATSTMAHAERKSEPVATSTLKTNEALIEDMKRGANLNFESAMDAFRVVFAKLPRRVFVYPTENYYYWTLSAGGVTYAGNLRLAAQDRDRGILHVAAFQQANAANTDTAMMYKKLTARDGVQVEKVTAFAYRVTFAQKTVLFQLNDLSSIKPPAEVVAPDERYLGTVYDESGLRFYLFYNARVKVFAYVLIESGDVLDQFEPIEEGARIEIGQRTGFALYRHHHLNRKVLIGVHGGNTIVNNYFDGPADQLPENHIVGDNLRRAIVDADPRYKGELDRFGYLNSGEGRYLIAPYIQYLDRSELIDFDDCATAPDVTKDLYDGCFHSGDE